MNTFLFLVESCKDNTDTACLCPNANYVNTVFECLYAHGKTDDIISDAIEYFQGICASHCGENPAIVTGAETITKVITATPTASPTVIYTTVFVDATTVVPCTSEDGQIIPGSSTTIIVSTTLAVPQVGFTTVSAGVDSSSVAVIPGNVATATAYPTATSKTAAVGSYTTAPTTLFTAPAGTGSLKSTSTRASSTAVVTAGAAHVGSGLGFLGFAAMALAAL